MKIKLEDLYNHEGERSAHARRLKLAVVDDNAIDAEAALIDEDGREAVSAAAFQAKFREIGQSRLRRAIDDKVKAEMKQKGHEAVSDDEMEETLKATDWIRQQREKIRRKAA